MMSDNYTTDELTRRGLDEMAYERDLQAQTARANALAAEVERLTADNAALRGQLAAGDSALVALLEISCVYTDVDGTTPLKTDDGRPKLFRWDKGASEPAFNILDQHGRLEDLGNGTFVARPAPPQE